MTHKLMMKNVNSRGWKTYDLDFLPEKKFVHEILSKIPCHKRHFLISSFSLKISREEKIKLFNINDAWRTNTKILLLKVI